MGGQAFLAYSVAPAHFAPEPALSFAFPPSLSYPLPFARQPLDRAGHLRGDGDALLSLRSDPQSLFLPIWRDRSLLREDESGAGFLTAAEIAKLNGINALCVFLGTGEGRAYFAVDISAEEGGDHGPAVLQGAHFANLRDAGPVLPSEDAALMAYAKGMIHWHAKHLYCSVCGAATQNEMGGHQRRCQRTECGALTFPRTDPVAIMLAIDESGRCLLGRQPSWPKGMYSALAGFIEPGETPEEAVVREVAEEAKIIVDEVRYAGAQPWPFPASLMLGFYARAKGETPTAAVDELEDVRWFTRAEVKDAKALGLFLPRRTAIARHLIEAWLKAEG